MPDGERPFAEKRDLPHMAFVFLDLLFVFRMVLKSIDDIHKHGLYYKNPLLNPQILQPNKIFPFSYESSWNF